MSRVLATALFTLVFAGCVADNGGEGFVIVANEFLAQGSLDCSVLPSAAGPFLSRGQISTRSPTGYVFTPVLQSRITSTSTIDTQQRTITLQGANVSLTVDAVTIGHADGTFSQGTKPTLTGTDANFLSQFSTSLPPDGVSGAVFEIVPVTTIAAIKQMSGAGATDTIDAEVTATIKPFGVMGGSRIDGTEFKYAVSVCSNCVVRDIGACPMNAMNKGNACNVYQDGVVDCCESASGLLCPAQ